MFAFLNGLLLGFSLIMALGPQNIFLIKQGIRQNHVVLSTLICFICDVLLICASVTGLHTLLLHHPGLQLWMVGLGSLFLLYYAAKMLISAFSKNNAASEYFEQPHNKIQIIVFAAGCSLLNPHAIIDSLVIIGSGSSQYPNHETLFLLGVISASFLWFSALFLTTRYFSKILSRAGIWKKIELCSGFLMTFMGVKLVLRCF